MLVGGSGGGGMCKNDTVDDNVNAVDNNICGL